MPENVGADALPDALAESVAEPETPSAFEGDRNLPAGASLQDAIDHLEGKPSEPPAETPEPPPDDTPSGETPPDTEPPDREPDEGDAPEATPADGSPPAEEEGQEDVPVVTDDQLGLPRPIYAQDRLNDSGYADEFREKHGIEPAEAVSRRLRRIQQIHAQERKSNDERWQNLDPVEARGAIDTLEDLKTNPRAAPVRDLALELEGKTSGNPWAGFALALLVNEHPQHLEAVRRAQGASEGKDNGQAPLPTSDDLLRASYDEETGVVDKEALNRSLAERDKEIARRAYAVAQQKLASPQEDAPEPAAAPSVDYFTLMLEAKGLDAKAMQPAMIDQARRAQYAGETIENTMECARKLVDRVLEERSKLLGDDDSRARQEEVARHKRASTSRPRTASPASGAPSVKGASLQKVLDLKAAGEINPEAEGY